MPVCKLIKYSSILFLLSSLYINLYQGNEVWALDNVQKLFKEAEQFYQAEDFRTALEKYKELVSLQPSNIEGYRGVNKCYSALNDLKGALIFMESLFLEYPERGEVLYGLGYSLYNLGDYDESLIYFKKAIEQNSNISAAWNNCAVIYDFIGKDYRKARYYYEKAIEKSKITGDDYVLQKAQENISNLPDPEEIKPVTEKYSLEDFINIFISNAENNRHRDIEKLISGQKENSEKAMDWLIGKALQAYFRNNLDEEKTLMLLADLLQEEYSISFKNSELFDRFIKYKNLSDIEKKEIVKGENLLEDGAEMERQSKYHDAVKKYEAALNCFENIDDKNRQGLILIHLGDAYRKLENYDLALEMYNKGLSCFDHSKTKEAAAYAFLSSGEIYFLLGKYPDSENNFNKALGIYSSLGDKETSEMIQRNLRLLENRK